MRVLPVLSLVAALAGLAPVGAQPGPLPLDSPLEVQILDPGLPWNAGLLGPGLPLRVGETQVSSLDSLREWLRIEAGRAVEAEALDAAGTIRPSRRTLRLVGDASQDAAWVLGMMHLVTARPGYPGDEEFRTSPLISRFRLALAGSDRECAFRIPLDRGIHPASGPPRALRLDLVVAGADRLRPVARRRVEIRWEREPVGAVTGLGWLAEHPAAFTMATSPGETFLRLRHGLKQAPKGTLIRVRASPEVPLAVLFEALRAARESGHEVLGLRGLSKPRWEALAAGRHPDGRTAALFAAARVPLPPPAAVAGQEEEEIVPAGVERAEPGGLSRALAWLKAHQEPDGRWSSQRHGGREGHDVGVTGLAILAFLGEGSTPRSGPHREAVRRGLSWLLEQQDAEGCLADRKHHAFAYSHAIATLVLCESYAMTKDSSLAEPARKALTFVHRMRNPYKGWRYGIRPGDNDTSVTLWMVMALRSGQLAGLGSAGDKAAFDGAMTLVEELTDENTGRTGYARRGERSVRMAGTLDEYPAEKTETLTAGGILVRTFCGRAKEGEAVIAKGAGLLRACLPVWDPQAGGVDHYYWYLGTLAAYQVGGETWKAWHPALTAALEQGQIGEGAQRGAWPKKDPWFAEGGRVYVTALSALCLEVVQRYGNVVGGGR